MSFSLIGYLVREEKKEFKPGCLISLMCEWISWCMGEYRCRITKHWQMSYFVRSSTVIVNLNVMIVMMMMVMMMMMMTSNECTDFIINVRKICNGHPPFSYLPETLLSSSIFFYSPYLFLPVKSVNLPSKVHRNEAAA